MTVDWNTVAALGQAIAAVCAVAALGAVAYQIRSARLVADLTALQEFVRSAREYEAALLIAPAEQMDSAFVDLMNFLEMSCAAINGGLYPKTSRKLVKEKLTHSLAIIQNSADWHPRLTGALTTHTTFAEITKFLRDNRVEIARATAQLNANADLHNATAE